MSMLSRSNDPAPNPEEILIGTCATCGHSVEVLRMRAKTSTRGMFGSWERAENLGSWDDMPYVECEACKARSPKQAIEKVGPRIQLRKKHVDLSVKTLVPLIPRPSTELR